MRVRRLAVALSALGVMVGISLAASPGAGADEGGGAQRVRLQDDCDPASFNAALGDPTACVGKGKTTFDDFIAQLVADGAAKRWEFKPKSFHIDADEGINAVSRGGEFHTFTEVANFGGGCVPQLNEVLGLTPVPECDDVVQTPNGPVPAAFLTSGVPSGGSLMVPALIPGTHKFMCLIHPWMQSVVDVRADDHGGHHHGD